MTDILKRKMLLIAIGLFATSTMTVFYLQDSDKLSSEVNHKDLQTFVLQEEGQNEVLSEDEYRQLLDNYEDDFAIVNIDRTFKFLSDNLSKTHGYTEDEWSDINVLTFIHPKDLPEFTNNLLEYHKTEEPVGNIGPIRIKTSTGEYLPYIISLVPTKNHEKVRTGTAVVLKDISKPIGERAKPNNVLNVSEEKTAEVEAEKIKNAISEENYQEIKGNNDEIGDIQELSFPAKSEEDIKTNNGHGNNDDGVDTSNPGAEKSTNNKLEDTSGSLDDEGDNNTHLKTTDKGNSSKKTSANYTNKNTKIG